MYLFLCDGKAEGCAQTNCYKSGGECLYTTDINHAVNFSKEANLDDLLYVEKESYIKKLVYVWKVKLILVRKVICWLKIRLPLLNHF